MPTDGHPPARCSERYVALELPSFVAPVRDAVAVPLSFPCLVAPRP